MPLNSLPAAVLALNEAKSFVLNESNFIEPNIDKYSAKLYASLLILSDLNQNKVVKNVINILTYEQISIESTQCGAYETCNVAISKENKTYICCVLRQFKYKGVDDSLLRDLHLTLVERINFLEAETNHILKGLLHMYKKHEFKSEKLIIMTMLRKLFYSPLQEILITAQNIAAAVTVWYTDEEIKDELKKFFAITDWDSHHYYLVGCFIKNSNDAKFYELIVTYCFHGFQSDYCSYAASILFTNLLNKCDFEMFEEKIFPVFAKHLTRNGNRTLSGSITKYVVSACLDRYRNNFYDICMNLPNTNFTYKLSLVSYNCVKYSQPKTRGVFQLAASCLQIDDDANIQIAFGIICRHAKLNASILPSEIALIERFIMKFQNFDRSHISSLHRLISHMSVTFNSLRSNRERERYLQFFEWLFVTCTIKLKENCEETTKIFGHVYYTSLKVLTGSSKALQLSYNVPKGKCYDDFQNPIYCVLVKRNRFRFTSRSIAVTFVSKYIDRDYYVDVISNIITEYLLPYISNDDVVRIGEKLFAQMFMSSYYASNRAVYYIRILLKYYDKSEGDCVGLFQNILLLVNLQFREIKDGEIYEAIRRYPIFIGLQCILHIVDSRCLMHDNLLVLFDFVQDITTYILDNVFLRNTDSLFLESKSNKALEHTIIICTDLMHSILSATQYPLALSNSTVKILTRVITDTNFRRPVSHAGLKLEQILGHASKHRQAFLEFYESQEKSFDSVSKRSSTIRRKAGTRLIVHAFVRGMSGRNFLHDRLQFLLRTGGDLQNCSDTVAAALHTLESLISDSTLKSKVAVYVPQVLEVALKNMDCKNFHVKNASVQVFQAVTNRLLGQKSETGRRQFSAAEIFQAYPEIAATMLRDLSTYDANFAASKVAILGFLSETNYCRRMYAETTAYDFNSLKSLFKHPDVARFAVSAYVATCASHEVFNQIVGDVEYLADQEVSANENFYYHCAIEQLYKRLMLYGTRQDRRNFRHDLILKKSKVNATALTNLFNLPPNSITAALGGDSHSDADLIFVLKHVSPSKLCRCLNICLHLNRGELFLCNCLATVTEVCNTHEYSGVVCDVTVALINFLMAMKNCNKFVVVLFYKTIMQLFDLQKDFDRAIRGLREFGKSIAECDIYTQHIWLLVYGCKSVLNSDETKEVANILSNCVKISEIGETEDCYQISTMLKNLYVSLSDANKSDFLYLLVVLVLQLDDMQEIDECFLYLTGKKLRTQQYLDELILTEKSMVFRNSDDVKGFACKLNKFLCNYDVVHDKDESFYAKSGGAVEKLTLAVHISQLLCNLYKDSLNY